MQGGRLALEDVIEEIERQTRSSVENVMKEAEKESERIKSQAQKESEKRASEFKEETKRMLEERNSSETLAAKVKQKRMILAAKKMAADSIFESIKQKLSAVSEKEKESIIGLLVERARKELPDAKYIYSNQADKKSAEKSGLEFAGIIDCMGGVIVEDGTKSVRVNMTFDRLFEEFKEGINAEITKVLQ